MSTKKILNGYPIDCVEVDGVKMFNFRTAFLIAFDFTPLNNVSQELRSVSKCNYIRTGKGRASITYISADGFAEYLNCTTRISINQKRKMLLDLLECGFESSITISNTRKELNFYDELSEFLSVFGVKIERGVSSGLGHVFDLVVGGWLVVEYDENEHINYNKKSEEERELAIKELGYDLFRASDKFTNTKNIALLISSICDINQEMRIALTKAIGV